jgi:hypothetical protein
VVVGAVVEETAVVAVVTAGLVVGGAFSSDSSKIAGPATTPMAKSAATPAAATSATAHGSRPPVNPRARSPMPAPS